MTCTACRRKRRATTPPTPRATRGQWSFRKLFRRLVGFQEDPHGAATLADFIKLPINKHDQVIDLAVFKTRTPAQRQNPDKKNSGVHHGLNAELPGSVTAPSLDRAVHESQRLKGSGRARARRPSAHRDSKSKPALDCPSRRGLAREMGRFFHLAPSRRTS
jgi:hypothetical protein